MYFLLLIYSFLACLVPGVLGLCMLSLGRAYNQRTDSLYRDQGHIHRRYKASNIFCILSGLASLIHLLRYALIIVYPLHFVNVYPLLYLPLEESKHEKSPGLRT